MGGTEHDHSTPEPETTDSESPTSVTPAPAPAAVTADQVKARWAAFGPNEQLAVGGGIAILVAYVLGLILENWSFGLSSILVVLATIEVIVIVAMALKGLAGMSRTLILRVSAGIIGAYALVDLGDLIDGLGFWTVLDIILSIAYIAGAAVLVLGVWRLTGGDIVKDVMGLAKAGGRTMPERLVSLGASGVIVGWALLQVIGGAFRTEAALSIITAVLALTVLWLSGSGKAEFKLPVASNVALAGLGIATAVLVAIWVVAILDELSRVPALGWPGLIVLVAGAAAIAAGGALGMQPAQEANGAASTGSSGEPGGTAA